VWAARKSGINEAQPASAFFPFEDYTKSSLGRSASGDEWRLGFSSGELPASRPLVDPEILFRNRRTGNAFYIYRDHVCSSPAIAPILDPE